MTSDEIRESTKCCACERAMIRSVHINLMTLDFKATWKYPVCGNVITGDTGYACAIICDDCLGAKRTIRFAIEFDGDFVIYHAVEKAPCT